MVDTHFGAWWALPRWCDMFEDSSLLLLTGATGLVGGALLKLLPDNKPRRFMLLTREPEKLAALYGDSTFRILKGDLTRPHLGLDPHTYAGLTRSITEIIHCAADTRFGISLDAARRVNTAGTQEVLNLASECARLEKFAYISTVYVVGRSAGYFSEDSIRHQNGFCNAYQQSKYEAEQLVSQAMDDLPAVIFRLSSIVGDSVTGAVPQFNYVHRLIRLFPQNVLPIAPGEPEAPIDLIASDWAVAALAYLFESAFIPCRFYHICAGPERSLTLREMIDLTISVFESHPLGRKWLPIRVPELVCLSRYEKFVESRGRKGDRIFNELVRVLGYFLPHLAIFQAFDNTSTIRSLESSGLRMPSIHDCYERAVRFCLDTNWGRSLQRQYEDRPQLANVISEP
jgi:nucleoside-diphosphate-sugar epimerase